jgi:cytochrome P450
MKHWFSDLMPFQRDPLGLMLGRVTSAEAPLERLHLGPAPVWLVTDPELMKPVLRAPEDEIDKGRLIHKLRKVIGLSSLSLSGEEHKRRRAVLHATFAKGTAQQYAPEMSAVIRRLAARLLKETSFDAHTVTSRLSLRLISLVMFGKDVLTDADEQVIVEAVRQVEDDLADEIFRVLLLTPWERARRERKRAFANEAMSVVVRRVLRDAPPTSAVRALQQLGLTEVEMRDEVLTMILAGYHTTGSATAWLFYHLATEHTAAEAVRREADTLVLPSGELATDRIATARASLAFARETLRLYPSSHWFSRDAMADVEIGGRRLRRGDAIMISPWAFHRSSRWWASPDRFNLDRDFACKAYVPFGLGPRTCVGMGVVMLELQLIALEMAAAFDLKVLSSVPASAPKSSITLLPPPITMSISVRDHNKAADNRRIAA